MKKKKDPKNNQNSNTSKTLWKGRTYDFEEAEKMADKARETQQHKDLVNRILKQYYEE